MMETIDIQEQKRGIYIELSFEKPVILPYNFVSAASAIGPELRIIKNDDTKNLRKQGAKGHHCL